MQSSSFGLICRLNVGFLNYFQSTYETNSRTVFTRASHAGLIAPKNAGQIRHDLVGILSFNLFYSAAPIKSPLVTWPFGLSVRFVT